MNVDILPAGVILSVYENKVYIPFDSISYIDKRGDRIYIAVGSDDFPVGDKHDERAASVCFEALAKAHSSYMKGK